MVSVCVGPSSSATPACWRRTATTHWASPMSSRPVPDVNCARAALPWTRATCLPPGARAGLDLCLHVVREQMVPPTPRRWPVQRGRPHREGGQAQSFGRGHRAEPGGLATTCSGAGHLDDHWTPRRGRARRAQPAHPGPPLHRGTGNRPAAGSPAAHRRARELLETTARPWRRSPAGSARRRRHLRVHLRRPRPPPYRYRRTCRRSGRHDRMTG